MMRKRIAGLCIAASLVACAAQVKAADTITVVSGTYGGNCNQPTVNKTEFLAKACNGQTT